MITHIIWDFNGTVLDDVHMSVAAVNDMLSARGLPLTNADIYRNTLTMPLTEYYKTVGIYSDDIAALAEEFYGYCEKHPDLAGIFNGIAEVTAWAHKSNIKNILMSSLHHDRLLAEAEKYNVLDMFDSILGLPDRALGSKYDNAMKFFKENGIDAKNTLFIGDLASDAQMAKKLGADCILVSNGHMSHERCKDACEKVFKNVTEIIGYIQRT